MLVIPGSTFRYCAQIFNLYILSINKILKNGNGKKK